MNKEFWEKRWTENQIGFHEGRPNVHLERFVERLRVSAAPRVLVPLCGKTMDLRWLAERNFRVLGVEFVAEAAQAFFRENALTAVSGEDGGLPSLRSQQVCIATGDFFRWDPLRSDPVDVAYDRAALVAVRPEERKRYVAHLLGALRPGGRVLLVTFSYDQSAMTGPPFSVDAAEVRQLFGSRCDVEGLADDDILDQEPRFRQRGLSRLREQAWLLTMR